VTMQVPRSQEHTVAVSRVPWATVRPVPTEVLVPVPVAWLPPHDRQVIPVMVPVGSPPSEMSTGFTRPKPVPAGPKAPARPRVGRTPTADGRVVVEAGGEPPPPPEQAAAPRPPTTTSTRPTGRRAPAANA